MITIRRSTLRRVAIVVLITLILGMLVLFTIDRLMHRKGHNYVSIVELWKDYIDPYEAWLRRNELIGQCVRVRGYLSNSGIGRTIEACDPPQYAFTSFDLGFAGGSIHLMDCTVDQCTMACPLFMPHIRQGYEIVGTLEYCPGSEEKLCLVDVSEIYLLKNAEEELRWMDQKILITPGPVSFPIGQEWEQWKP